MSQKMNFPVHLLTGLAALLGAGLAEAASLTLVAPSSTVTQNSTFMVDLRMNALDAPGPHPGGLYGGRIIIDFDPTKLEYVGFEPLAPVSYYVSPTSQTVGNLQKVNFGFNNGPENGLVGRFTFTAKGSVGSIANIGLADYDDFLGTFTSYVNSYVPFTPSFAGTSLTIQAVPLPAGLWFLATGVAALGLKIRRRAS
jgi:hypothetical protein